MNEHARAFDLLCEYLSFQPRVATEQDCPAAVAGTPSLWAEFIKVATDHFMGPVLALRFESLGLSGVVPPLVVRHCNALLRLNRARNAKLRTEAIELAANLNEIDVVPVFLKGGAGLLSEIYEDPGARVMGDLDVLVPIDRARDCARHLAACGFRNAATNRHPRDHSTGHFLGAHSIAPVDLHHEVIAWPNQRLLSGRETIESCVIFETDGVTAAVPSVTHQVVLNIGHAHLNNYAYRFGLLPLRSFYDLAYLTQSPSAVDWKLVDGRFAAIGEKSAVEYHCLAAAATLNVAPRPGFEPRPQAQYLLRRAQMLTKHPRLQRTWYRFARVAMLLRREFSDAELRARLIHHLSNWDWWQRHLTLFWRGKA